MYTANATMGSTTAMYSGQTTMCAATTMSTGYTAVCTAGIGLKLIQAGANGWTYF